MAHERKPVITLDPLQPDGTRRSFRATWTEGTLCAYAELVPFQDNPHNGYVLECWYDRTTTRGAMGQRQEEQGRKLVTQVQAYMQAALLDTGWIVAKTGKDAATPNVWKHQSQLTPAPIQQKLQPEQQNSQAERQAYKTIEVYGNKEARERGQGVAYRRVISLHSVLVTCTKCGQKETQERYPGPKPRYCHTCAEEAARERTRLRVQNLRKRRQEQGTEPPTTTVARIV